MKAKTSEAAKVKAREELHKAVTVLKHIKKRAGPGIHDVEYQALLEEVQIITRQDGENHEKVKEKPKTPPVADEKNEEVMEPNKKVKKSPKKGEQKPVEEVK